MAEKKVALVVGNATYSDDIFGQLATPENDAEEMVSTLEKLGFDTFAIYNGNRQQILDAIYDFEVRLNGADVGVFYYSGHGTDIGGESFIVPCKTIIHQGTLSDECIRVRNIQAMLKRQCRISFLFMDSCRNAPGEYGREKGLNSPQFIPSNEKDGSGPAGQMIFYATEKGATASTGYGRLSPFTQVLVQHLFSKLEFRSVLPLIEEDVSNMTKQHPTVEGSYTGDFYFNPNGVKGGDPTYRRPESRAPSSSMRMTVQQLIDAGKQNDGKAATIAKAIGYYRQAAERGSIEGMFLLGKAYTFGNKATKDKVQAKYWLDKVISSGQEPWCDMAQSLKNTLIM